MKLYIIQSTNNLISLKSKYKISHLTLLLFFLYFFYKWKDQSPNHSLCNRTKPESIWSTNKLNKSTEKNPFLINLTLQTKPSQTNTCKKQNSLGDIRITKTTQFFRTVLADTANTSKIDTQRIEEMVNSSNIGSINNKSSSHEDPGFNLIAIHFSGC